MCWSWYFHYHLTSFSFKCNSFGVIQSVEDLKQFRILSSQQYNAYAWLLILKTIPSSTRDYYTQIVHAVWCSVQTNVSSIFISGCKELELFQELYFSQNIFSIFSVTFILALWFSSLSFSESPLNEIVTSLHWVPMKMEFNLKSTSLSICHLLCYKYHSTHRGNCTIGASLCLHLSRVTSTP